MRGVLCFSCHRLSAGQDGTEGDENIHKETRSQTKGTVDDLM